ncbi:class I adenylate-forming enzyme family protein [Patulibacter minatonensis]|uniref:class I adenylate-forming enzyme family protein n=1 Tax=Patulibacter minatonensis TaxID=298163 RepID=UPI0009FC4551|nr:class I adenylate-forming enzyme family protein [Patulibacter minatonensis]
MNLGWWLERAWWEHPDKTAVVNGNGTSATYTELRALSNRLSNVLVDDAGLKEDDVVATILHDDHRHMAIFYAAIRAGGAFTGLNRRNLPEKFVHDVERSQASILIVSPEFLPQAELLEDQPSIRRIYVTEGEHPRYPNIGELLDAASDEFRVVARAEADLAAINFTSGTSGTSKGVMYTHGKLGVSCWNSIFLTGMRSDAKNVSLISMFHSGGIADCIRNAMVGGTILWTDGWDVDRVVRIIREHKPNWMYYIIPTMVRDLLRHPDWPGLDLDGLHTHVSGEPIPPDVSAALEKKGVRIGRMYGMTETMPVCVLATSLYYGDEDPPDLASGKPSKTFCEVKLADPVTGETLEGGDVEGEICIRGDVVTPGYFNDPERTAASFDDEGYLHTRDNAYRDQDGWLYIRGRTDDIINTGGEKLSLLEIDEILLSHPDVHDAGVVGADHERFGEVPAAFVVMKTSVGEEEARDILDAWCLERLERWKRPRLYALIDELPRTAKQTKMTPVLKRYLEGHVIKDADGITTLSGLKAAR